MTHKNTTTLRSSLCAAALFVIVMGCSGGSETPSQNPTNSPDSQEQPVQNDPPVQPNGDQGNGESNDQGDGNGNGNNEDTTSAGNETAPPNEETPGNSNDPSDTQQNADLYCKPISTSVSYERYCPNGTCYPRSRHYVPFPASGFGWDGSQVCDMAESRGVDTIEVLVPYSKRRPDVDGVVNYPEWYNAAEAGTSNYEVKGNDIDNLLVATVPDYLDGAGYSTWSAVHDGENLYLLVRVSNDTRNNIIVDSEEPWNDDALEILIDGDNSKGDSYDGINDFQAHLPWQADTSNRTLPFMSPDSAPGLGIFYRSGGNPISALVEFEIAINLKSAGIEIGRPFGFDVHINEDDNYGDRDAKWGWFEKSGFDRSWFQPSVFGTLLLTDCEDRDTCGTWQVVSK